MSKFLYKVKMLHVSGAINLPSFLHAESMHTHPAASFPFDCEGLTVNLTALLVYYVAVYFWLSRKRFRGLFSRFVLSAHIKHCLCLQLP